MSTRERLSPAEQAKAHCDALELLVKRPEITLEDLAMVAAQLNRVSDVVLRRTEAVVDIEPQPRREPSYRRPNAAPQSAVSVRWQEPPGETASSAEQRLTGLKNALAGKSLVQTPHVVDDRPNGMSGERFGEQALRKIFARHTPRDARSRLWRLVTGRLR